jgi:hypothetical protein
LPAPRERGFDRLGNVLPAGVNRDCQDGGVPAPGERGRQRARVPGSGCGVLVDVWSIAITKGGVFAAHVLRGGEAPLLGTDPDFRELERKFLIPADVAEAASEALKSIDWVVRRDI